MPWHEPLKVELRQKGMPHLYDAICSLSEIQEKTARALNDVTAASQKILTAFPNGDIDGHRFYHDALIKKIAAREKLAEAIKEKTIISLIWMGLSALGIAIWHEVQRRFVMN